MKKRELKHVLCLLLAGAQLILGLASCSKNEQSRAAVAPIDDMSRRHHFTFAMLNWGQLNKNTPDYNSDDVAQMFEKKFNFDWDIIQTTWADWIEKPRIWINSGDMPDMMFVNFNFKDIQSWMEQDLIKRLPDGWKTKYPNITKVYERTVVGPALEKQIPGNTAFLPNVVFFNMPTQPKLANHWSIFFRKDWARALGFEIKDQYTLKEFTDMIQKFQAQGSSLPGVSGRRVDTWNLDTSRVSETFITSQWADAQRFYKDSSGKYVWGPDDPRILPLLQNMKDAISKGIVSKNFASFTNDEQDDLFFAGQAFGIFTNGWIEFVYRYYNRFQDITGIDPFESIQEATLTNTTGNYEHYEELNFFSGIVFNPKLDDAKLDRLLKFINFVVSDEGQDLARMGIEGNDYTKSGDTITITRAKDANGNFEEIYNIYPFTGTLSHMLICADNFSSQSPAIPKKYRDVVDTMYATKQKIGIDVGTVKDFNFELYFFDGPNYLKFNTGNTTNIGNEMVRIAMMDGDLKTNYEKWLRDMHVMVDPVLKELNDAFGNNK
jgi:putative aldouronate transport system substrate-binding protein